MSDTTERESRRMALRGIIHLAGEVIPQSWPVRTFVHHNPLHGLEHLPFDQAVRRAGQFLGGRGYLSGDVYRGYLHSGRIQRRDLEEALRPFAREESVTLGRWRITHAETLLACLTHGLGDGDGEGAAPDELTLALAARLNAAVPALSRAERAARTVREDQGSLGRLYTLSDWCDRTLGTALVEQTNAELIRWCESFLDEGHAAWPMPGRELGFYLAWKALAVHRWAPCGIADSRSKIAALPEHPEDAILEALDAMKVPEGRWLDYLALELTDLPGWAGFIKWRGEQREHPWQQAYPASLVKLLAVRLWYARELVQKACREHLAIDGTFEAVLAYLRDRPEDYLERKQRGAAPGGPETTLCAARDALALARALDIEPDVLLASAPEDVAIVVRWISEFPAGDHGPVWLAAFEAGYREHLFGVLRRHAARGRAAGPAAGAVADVRPQSQSLWCIDVRSEPFRRHLEAMGNHQTFAFPGFFAAAIRYRAWGRDHWDEQFPAVMRARNEVREVPRGYLGQLLHHQQSRAKLLHASHTLVHELKENVVTPYVMVETLGWFYGLPLIGKTLFPQLYRRVAGWLERLVVPRIATSVTVDKLSPEEVDEMLASEQRVVAWRALRERTGLRGGPATAALVEALRLHALGGEGELPQALVKDGAALEVGEKTLVALVDELRREARLDRRSAAHARERITRTGFTTDEQVLTVETIFRMIGLTRRFARLVLFCGHGSTSENNPYESALNCGACGGNAGAPNARVLAGMANAPAVRARLAANGIEIPPDTHFIGGLFDTTTDRVTLYDLEDVPPTHRKDVARLADDLREAGQLTGQERLARLPDVAVTLAPSRACAQARDRSGDWSQTRPEWGLSGNAAFVVGPRDLTRGLNLGGRVFMHCYEHRDDPTGRMLEVILTGAQLVCHWISMEHYFSTVDNEVYGSGSKVYHNVTGRVGIMSGPWSDLRLGLAQQSVISGAAPYHEPMRLITVVEAPRARLDRLIARHSLLQHYYHNHWVQLAALDPDDGQLYRYGPSGGWVQVHGKES